MHFPELLTTDEVAAMLKISRRAVWRLVASGQLRRIKLPGNKNRYFPADVWTLVVRLNPELVRPDDEEFFED